jgi:NAD(P)-dependent dehydrogenase (short-subunit alcohol dehydrogenase family)
MKAADLFDVRGLVTIVTGGASGIGYGYAEVMAANGANVTLFDVDGAAARQAAQALTKAHGVAVGSETVDVTDRAALDRAVDAVVAATGRLDVMFANAGIGGGPGFLTGGSNARNAERAIEKLPLEQLERVFAVNVTGALATIQAAVRHMRPRKSGRIIVTSSIDSFITEQYVGTPYVISKGAVGQMVRQAALELAAYGITVNAIAPGPTVTNISGGRLKEPAALETFRAHIPMHRLGTPEDLHGLALFLASPSSRYITGVHVVADGGYVLGPAD